MLCAAADELLVEGGDEGREPGEQGLGCGGGEGGEKGEDERLRSVGVLLYLCHVILL